MHNYVIGYFSQVFVVDDGVLNIAVKIDANLMTSKWKHLDDSGVVELALYGWRVMKGLLVACSLKQEILYSRMQNIY